MERRRHGGSVSGAEAEERDAKGVFLMGDGHGRLATRENGSRGAQNDRDVLVSWCCDGKAGADDDVQQEGLRCA
jgi:hypothetical protein